MGATGMVFVEKVRGKSTATRCFSKYPLKLIIPTKVGSSKIDVVWIYSLSYGGGIVSGDSISCSINVEDGCTAAFTTQASTKVYKSIGSKTSEQIMEVKIGKNAFLAVIPDPVTCFAAARYYQQQVFRVAPDSSLVVVDWFTSGRHENGEKWNFEVYKSTNNIFLNDEHPLLLDSVLLDQGSAISIAESMCNYQVIAMVIFLGPKLKCVLSRVQEKVKKMMSAHYLTPGKASTSVYHNKPKSDQHGGGGSAVASSSTNKASPSLIASCNAFGPKEIGLVVRIAALTTESVYAFLREHLASIESLIGAAPYC